MEEKIVKLDEDDLDTIVGGAYNQQAIAKFDLATRTSRSGAIGLYVATKHASGQLPGSFQSGTSQSWTSEETLKTMLANHPNLSVSVQTTSGEMKTLTKSELGELLSK